MRFSSATFAIALCIMSPTGHAFGEAAPVGKSLAVHGHFDAPSSDKSKKPRGISGMACLGKAGDRARECFAINDEEKFGEVVVLGEDGLAPTGRTVTLVVDEHNDDVLGTSAMAPCPKGSAKNGEFDGEGVAIARTAIYVSGSHSCSGNGKFKASSYLLARFATAADGHIPTPPASIERTWRLSDALKASGVKDAFGAEKTVGTNIEGIAVLKDRLYAGLRTPVSSEIATIVSVPVEDLFAPGNAPLAPDKVKTIQVKLDPDTGIRDLAAVDENSLLILSGPTVDQGNVDYKLSLLASFRTDKVNKPSPLITLPLESLAGVPGKAETVTILGKIGPSLDILILYDNLDEGRPTEYNVSLPLP